MPLPNPFTSDESREQFSEIALRLFKPWRSEETEIVAGTSSFAQQWEEYLANLNERAEQDILLFMQVFSVIVFKKRVKVLVL